MAKVRVRLFRGSRSAPLQLALGLFFVTLGVVGIIPQAGEGIFGLSKDRTALEILFGVIELACGAFFLVDGLAAVPRRTSSLVTLAIGLLWTARIVLTVFVQGIVLSNSGVAFRPDFWNWALTLATDLVVLSAVWSLYRRD
jgi:hypothetical protein